MNFFCFFYIFQLICLARFFLHIKSIVTNFHASFASEINILLLYKVKVGAFRCKVFNNNKKKIEIIHITHEKHYYYYYYWQIVYATRLSAAFKFAYKFKVVRAHAQIIFLTRSAAAAQRAH